MEGGLEPDDNKRYDSTELEEVDWDGTDDPRNSRNWSARRR